MMHRGPNRGPAAPLPPPQREMMHRGPHRGPVMPLPPMSEVDRAKFAELNEVIRDAMDDFRQEGSEANRAKLRAAVDAMVEARLKYDVEQAEKKLEFVKARLEKKAVLTERYLKRMTAKEPEPRGTLPVEVEESLKQVLGSEVNVAYHGGKGKLTVHFYSDEQLRAFANLLGQYQTEE